MEGEEEKAHNAPGKRRTDPPPSRCSCCSWSLPRGRRCTSRSSSRCRSLEACFDVQGSMRRGSTPVRRTRDVPEVSLAQVLAGEYLEEPADALPLDADDLARAASDGSSSAMRQGVGRWEERAVDAHLKFRKLRHDRRGLARQPWTRLFGVDAAVVVLLRPACRRFWVRLVRK